MFGDTEGVFQEVELPQGYSLMEKMRKYSTVSPTADVFLLNP